MGFPQQGPIRLLGQWAISCHLPEHTESWAKMHELQKLNGQQHTYTKQLSHTSMRNAPEEASFQWCPLNSRNAQNNSRYLSQCIPPASLRGAEFSKASANFYRQKRICLPAQKHEWDTHPTQVTASGKCCRFPCHLLYFIKSASHFLTIKKWPTLLQHVSTSPSTFSCFSSIFERSLQPEQV